MKFKHIFLFLFAFAALLSAQAFAAAGSEAPTVNVSLSTGKDAILPGECGKYVATVRNLGTQGRADFMVEGTRLSWVSLGDAYFDFGADPLKDVIFYICPPIGTISGTYNFVFSAKSRLNNYTNSNPFAIFVMDRPYLEIRDVTTSKDVYSLGESIDFTVNVRNLGMAEAKNVRVVADIAGASAPDKMRLLIPSIEAGRGNSATGKFDFDRYGAHGNYVITAAIVDDIGDVLYSKSKPVQIEEKSELKQETAVKSDALSKEVELKGANTGNKRDTITLESSGISYLALYTFSRQPDSIAYSGAAKIFRWKCDLGPGETCNVSYRVEYWLLVVLVVAAFGIIYVVYSLMEQPVIKKKVVKVEGREHTVHIAVKNRSRKALHQVQVIDTVPEVVSVVPDSFSPRIMPNIKSKRGGNELSWTFAKLEPNEERIITYRIRPLVMLLGAVRLPKARIYAVDARGKKYRAESSVMVN